MTLWQKNGSAPQTLPFKDYLADGTIYTDLANNPEGREVCGWTQAPDAPAAEDGHTVEWVDGAWAQVPIPPPPPPPRAELPKSLVMDRAFALGFAPQIAQLFAANFQLQAQWFSPDWPNVFCDDPGLLQALAAVGMSSDQIAQVTAPR